MPDQRSVRHAVFSLALASALMVTLTGSSRAQSPHHAMVPARAGGAHSQPQAAPPNPNGTWNVYWIISFDQSIFETETITNFVWSNATRSWTLNWNDVFTNGNCIGTTTISGSNMKARAQCFWDNMYFTMTSVGLLVERAQTYLAAGGTSTVAQHFGSQSVDVGLFIYEAQYQGSSPPPKPTGASHGLADAIRAMLRQYQQMNHASPSAPARSLSAAPPFLHAPAARSGGNAPRR